jgi:large subunit ribosomal protein L20
MLSQARTLLGRGTTACCGRATCAAWSKNFQPSSFSPSSPFSSLLAPHGRRLLQPSSLSPSPQPFLQQQQQQPARGFASQKHKKMLKLSKGYRGRANSAYSVALQRVQKAMQYAYRDRRTRKREYRKEWILRINAATRQHGMVYSKFINGMQDANIELNRKVLADLAVTEPLSFKAVVDVVKSAAPPKAR